MRVEKNSTVEDEFFLVEPLTRREREIISLLANGLTDREIADTLTVALSTVKWYNKQIYGKLGVNDRQTAVKQARTLGLIEYVSSSQHTIPLESTKFIGRESDLTKIKNTLKDPNCRLLTLMGLGGIGKTRLALQTAAELANEQLPLFSDGIHFISLAAERKTSRLPAAISEVLGIMLMGTGEPTAQLANYLRNKKMLLVLDNFEQLLEGAEIITELLAEAPCLKVLVTSREALNLSEEWRFEVTGLLVPGVFQQELDKTEAVQLFVDRALHVKPYFSTEDNAACIADICRMVDGTPLAIELAASWIRSLNCADIANEIRTSLDFLETSWRDIPDRHQSMRAIFDQFWVKLNDAEKAVFRALSVFSGGASLAAAKQVTGATLPVLTSLVDRSMLRRGSDGRYRMHKLLNAYAAEKLAGQPKWEQEVRDLYCDYFSELALKFKTNVHGGKLVEDVQHLYTDISNLVQAWEWSLEKKDIPALNRMIHTLWYLFWVHGRVKDGLDLCRELIEQIEIPEEAQDGYTQLALLHCKALTHESFFINEYENTPLAFDRLNAAQQLLDSIDPETDEFQFVQGWIWLQQGRTGMFLRELGEVRLYAEKSIRALSSSGDDNGACMAWNCLAGIARREGKYEEYLEANARSRAIAERLGNQLSVVASYCALAVAQREHGKFDGVVDTILGAVSAFREANSFLIMGWMLEDLSKTHWYLGNYQDSVDTALECISTAQNINLERLLSAGINCQAAGLLHLGEYQEALSLAERTYADASSGVIWDPFIQLTYGEAALVMKEYDLAFRLLEESNQLFPDRIDLKASIPLTSLPIAALAKGDLVKAEEYLKEALSLAALNRREFLAKRALVAGAALAAVKGDQMYAARLYHLADDLPHIANSKWFAYIVGRFIDQDALAEAENMPRVQTLWQAVEDYLESL